MLQRVAAAVCFAALLAAPAFGSVPLGSIPLQDQSGQRFSLDDLRGRPVVVTFVATRCVDACPIANGVFMRLRDELAAHHRRATLVTITLDPRYDTPFVMAAEAQRFKADPSTWRFASGNTVDVRHLMRALGVEAVPDAKGVPEVHSSFVYLFDARGRARKPLLLSTNSVAEILREVAR